MEGVDTIHALAISKSPRLTLEHLVEFKLERLVKDHTWIVNVSSTEEFNLSVGQCWRCFQGALSPIPALVILVPHLTPSDAAFARSL